MRDLRTEAIKKLSPEVLAALNRSPSFGDKEQIDAQKELASLMDFMALPDCAVCGGDGGEFDELTGCGCDGCDGVGKTRQSFDQFEQKHAFNIWRYLP